MHKKQYEALAQAIKENSRTEVFRPDLIDKWDFLKDLCDILQADNKNFNKSKFMEACK